MKRIVTLESLKDTQILAESLARHVKPGFVLCLAGDLGAGKTTFTQFLGKSMGIEETINSPTFTIMKVYEHSPPLYHIDAYRLEGQVGDFELEEYIHDDGVAVIEWYRNIEEYLPEEYLSIEFKWIGDTKRQCTIEGSGSYADIAKALGD